MREVEARLKLSAVDKTATAFNSVKRKLAQVEKQVTAFNRAQMAVNRTLSALPLGRVLGPAVAGYAGVQAVKQFAEIERRMTRTGIVLGATRQQMQGLRGDIYKAAKDNALSADSVMETVDAYSAAGASMKDMKDDLGLLTKAQQALGASGADIANSWDAGRKTFGLLSEDAERYFEIIGAGSAAGKFEAKDLAQYMPSLLPVAARQGMGGLDGTERLVAVLEAMADFTGSSGEAATSMGDFLEKISSEAVEKNFADFGIDLPKRLKAARKEGKDLFRTMHDLMQEATKGDGTLLSKLFGDKEARRMADLVLNRFDAIERAQDRVEANAPGLLDRNRLQVLDDTEAKIQNISTAWGRVVEEIGGGLADVVAPVMEQVSDRLDFRNAMLAGGKKRGLTEEQTRWLMLTGSSHDRGLLAFDGGWTSDPLSGQGPRARSPELPGNRNDPSAVELHRQNMDGLVDLLLAGEKEPGWDHLSPLRYPAFPPIGKGGLHQQMKEDRDERNSKRDGVLRDSDFDEFQKHFGQRTEDAGPSLIDSLIDLMPRLVDAPIPENTFDKMNAGVDKLTGFNDRIDSSLTDGAAVLEQAAGVIGAQIREALNAGSATLAAKIAAVLAGGVAVNVRGGQLANGELGQTMRGAGLNRGME